MNEEKKGKKNYAIVSIGIIVAIALTLGITYAYWRLTKEQTGVNIVNSACLDVSIDKEQDDILLNKAYPISDEEGLNLTPYKFVITNKCDDYTRYNIGLEMLDETNLSSEYVKYSLSELELDNDYELEYESSPSNYGFQVEDDAIFATKTMDVCQAFLDKYSLSNNILEECHEEINTENLYIEEDDYNDEKTGLGFKSQDSCQSYLDESQSMGAEIITSCEQPEKIYTFKIGLKATYDKNETCQANLDYDYNVIKDCESVNSKPYVLNNSEYDEVTTYDTEEECNAYKTNHDISDNCEYRNTDINDLSDYKENIIKTKILGAEKEEESLKIEGTKEGRHLLSSTLKPKESKGYTLRVWLDGDVEVTDDAMNKTYKSKVVIESTMGEKSKRSDEVCNEMPDSIDCQLLKNDDENKEPQLMYDDTEDKNLRYVGENPNNYIDIGDNKYKHDIYKYGDDIWFEDDKEYNTLEECESNPEHLGGGTCKLLHKQGEPILWRIIGVMKNVTNVETGKEEDLIKIIRADSIGDYSWDTSEGGVNEDDDGVNDGYGVNEWSQADLMKLLNPGYDDNRDSICESNDNGDCSNYIENQLINNSLYWNNESGQCYISSKNKSRACDFTNIGINEEAKSKIAKVRWNTGTFATFDKTEWTASETYKAERSEYNGKDYCMSQWECEISCNACNDEVERTTKWDGYIGLIHPSDFGYAVGKNAREVCLAKSMNSYSNEGCEEADWLTLSDDEWTLNPIPDDLSADGVFRLVEGRLDQETAFGNNVGVRPVVFLKSNITITDGTGTFENPFVAS